MSQGAPWKELSLQGLGFRFNLDPQMPFIVAPNYLVMRKEILEPFNGYLRGPGKARS